MHPTPKHPASAPLGSLAGPLDWGGDAEGRRAEGGGGAGCFEIHKSSNILFTYINAFILGGRSQQRSARAPQGVLPLAEPMCVFGADFSIVNPVHRAWTRHSPTFRHIVSV